MEAGLIDRETITAIETYESQHSGSASLGRDVTDQVDGATVRMVDRDCYLVADFLPGLGSMLISGPG